jgi:hypothetical protein
MVEVDLDTLQTVFDRLEGRVEYSMGAKAPTLDCDTSEIHELDCSGFVRYILAKSTSQGLITPDGSVGIHAWAAANLQQCPYADVAEGTGLYIAFIAPSGGVPGHVWLCRQGSTRECCGSEGVCSRPWDDPILMNVCACYVLPSYKAE